MSAAGPSKPPPAGTIEPAAAFTPELDEQILRGLVEDEAALLCQMRERGHAESAVRARAARLGLTAQVVMRCRLAGSSPTMRECLSCETRFLSMGSHHRLCRRCQPHS